MKDMLNHPLSKIFSTFIVAVMLLAPFVNYPQCRNQIDNFIMIIYITVAIYMVGKKIIDEFHLI